MDRLPQEIIALCLSFLNIQETARASGTCSRWRAAVQLLPFMLCPETTSFGSRSSEQQSLPFYFSRAASSLIPLLAKPLQIPPQWQAELIRKRPGEHATTDAEIPPPPLLSSSSSSSSSEKTATSSMLNRLIWFTNEPMPNPRTAIRTGLDEKKPQGEPRIATFERLLELLLDQHCAGPLSEGDEFVQIFFSVNRSFSHPLMLLQSFFKRFQECSEKLKCTCNTALLSQQLRVVRALFFWVQYSMLDLVADQEEAVESMLSHTQLLHNEKNPIDWENNEEKDCRIPGEIQYRNICGAFMLFSQFLDRHLINNDSFPIRLLGAHLRHSWFKEVCRVREIVKRYRFPISPLGMEFEGTTDLLDLPDRVIAEQLTVQEFELFSSIRAYEFCDVGWRDPDPLRSPHVKQVLDRFKNLSSFVARRIVEPATKEERAAVMTRFLKLTLILLDLRNFETLFAVIAGLMSAATHRLKKTRELLDSFETNIWERSRELVSLRADFRMLRTTLASCHELPTIPYIGMFLADLKSCSDKVLTSEVFQVRKEIRALGVPLILWNPVKIDECQIIVNELQRWQYRITYTTWKGPVPNSSSFQDPTIGICKIPFVQRLIDKSLEDLPDDDSLYQLSLLREPRI